MTTDPAPLGSDLAAAGTAGAPASDGPLARTEGPWRRFLRRLRHQPLAMISLGFLVAMVLVAIFAPWLMPHDPSVQNLRGKNLPPSWSHPFGTDDVGRDLFSRMIIGTRITLTAPFIAVGVGAIIGVPLGLIAGYTGGAIDWVLSRAADALLAIPGIILAMAVVAVRGPSTTSVMAAVGVLFAPRLFRMMRGEAMSLKPATFIDSARVTGIRPARIITSHVLPNVVGSLIVQCTVLLGFGVLIEAALSFFGIGVQPPGASWGVVLRRTFDNIQSQPFQSVPPGVLISLLILSFQLLGDGMRDSLGAEVRHAR